MDFQPRFDEYTGIYRDCKWCGGKGCVSCRVEAQKAYEREFPDGPKPILEVPNNEEGKKELRVFLDDFLGKNKD